MHKTDDSRLGIPDDHEQYRLSTPTTLEATASFENASLAKALAYEAGGIYHIEHTVMNLAASPIWRVMLAELIACKDDPKAMGAMFLMCCARLHIAGSLNLLENADAK